MKNIAPESKYSDYNTKLSEYHVLAAKLRFPDTFKSPKERSEAVSKLKALRSELNGIYLDRHGLR
jgi:hypothetical protein